MTWILFDISVARSGWTIDFKMSRPLSLTNSRHQQQLGALLKRGLSFVACFACVATLGGCHVLSPKQISTKSYNVAPELIQETGTQIETGKPNKLLDGAGWVIGIPGKIMLWDRRIENHKITADTIETSAEYLQANQLAHVKVRLNQYAPWDDFKRLCRNKTVAWPYRYTLGILSVGGETILPGRLFGGDHFNPFTQTVHVFSDVPAIALHELAHAKDFSRRKYPGTYALGYLFLPAYHETIASRDAFGYLYDHQDREGVIEANRILYPAYGTYIGSGLQWYAPAVATPLYYGTVLAGHVNGRMLSRDIDEHLDEYQRLMAR